VGHAQPKKRGKRWICLAYVSCAYGSESVVAEYNLPLDLIFVAKCA
jgi:hypothetical protein